VRDLSFPQLAEYQKLHAALRIERQQRDLITATAAAAGGDAPQKMFRLLRSELRRLRDDGNRSQAKPDEPKSQMALSAEDFEKMMREENDDG
jgi:hypothetical protein